MRVLPARSSREMNMAKLRGWGRVVACSVLVWILTGCRSLPPMAAVNISDPGWRLRQGQAVWQPNRSAPEIAGEIVLASNPDGRSMLQFTKNPLPFVTVQTSNELWQVEFAPQKRRFSGRGVPTERLLWVHLTRALQNLDRHGPGPALRNLEFRLTSPNEWQLENRSTGERIFGYLNP
jgi:hypothetical protein